MRVPVKMEYELGALTEERLREMGARCVEDTLDVEYYYDTESFQLASTQTWLNQHEGQWGLILVQAQEITPTLSEETIKSKEEENSNMAVLSSQKRSETDSAFIENLGSPTESEKRYTADTAAASAYTELNEPRSIMMHITQCLQLPLTHTEVQKMTMKNFLRMAQIQIYDSWTRSRSVKYSLPGGFVLALERNYTTPTAASSVFLSMDADVLNISSELERMDLLHKNLGLKPTASSEKRQQQMNAGTMV